MGKTEGHFSLISTYKGFIWLNWKTLYLKKIYFPNTMSIFRKTSCLPSHQLKKIGKKKSLF